MYQTCAVGSAARRKCQRSSSRKTSWPVPSRYFTLFVRGSDITKAILCRSAPADRNTQFVEPLQAV